jgi:hypothetical protein
VEERGKGVYEDFNKLLYTINDPPEVYIDCSNPLCSHGGFSIGQILRQMVRDTKTHFEGRKGCRGYEGSPKDRRSCTNSWKVTIDLQLQE